MKTNLLGVDMSTRDYKKLARRLRSLKSTLGINGPMIYHQDPNLCQLHIETTMTENQLDNWLYRVNHGADYVGVYVRGAE
jgi:hypothetical protein